MELSVKKFSELSADALFDIYRLRNAVFIVEQNCVYQDVDFLDKDALHVLGYEKSQMLAYCRILPQGTAHEKAAIGRVLVDTGKRGHGLGKEIMVFALRQSFQILNTEEIIISAQSYLRRFYGDMGFIAEGAEYLEDGIPHVRMRLLLDRFAS